MTRTSSTSVHPVVRPKMKSFNTFTLTIGIPLYISITFNISSLNKLFYSRCA